MTLYGGKAKEFERTLFALINRFVGETGKMPHATYVSDFIVWLDQNGERLEKLKQFGEADA